MKKSEDVKRNGVEGEEVAEEKKSVRGDIIATRKACDATGTGLSHYILMDKKGK